MDKDLMEELGLMATDSQLDYIHYSGDMVYGWVNASDCEKI